MQWRQRRPSFFCLQVSGWGQGRIFHIKITHEQRGAMGSNFTFSLSLHVDAQGLRLQTP